MYTEIAKPFQEACDNDKMAEKKKRKKKPWRVIQVKFMKWLSNGSFAFQISFRKINCLQWIGISPLQPPIEAERKRPRWEKFKTSFNVLLSLFLFTAVKGLALKCWEHFSLVMTEIWDLTPVVSVKLCRLRINLIFWSLLGLV